MQWKFWVFVVAPLLMFGCTAIHYYNMSRSDEMIENKKLPERNEELDAQARDFFGRQE